MEILAHGKLKENAEQVQTTGEAEHVDDIITHRHKHIVTLEKSRSCGSVPIVDTNIIPNYFWKEAQISNLSMISNNKKLIDSMKLENVKLVVTPEKLNLGDRNHLPTHFRSQLVKSADGVAQNGDKLDFGGLPVTSSENHPNVTSDGKSQVHDIVFSDCNVKPTFSQVISRNSSDTNLPVSLIGSAGRTRDTSEQPHKLPENVSSSVNEHKSDLGSVEAGIQKLVGDLDSNSLETVRTAIAELRSLARHNTENRIMIAEHGAITFLVKLMYSTDAIIQEHAVTTLLNLSIHSDHKITIAEANVIEPLIHVLYTGSPEARENSAATFFSLAMVVENRVKIGRSGAIGPLVELLGNGTPRGRKDATTALFYLSMLPENKVKIVQAGAVKHLVELMDPSVGTVDKTVAVLANLATIQEGKVEIGKEGGIPVLVEAIELGSARGKENAAAALLRVCSTSNKFCIMALQEGVIPPLVALSHSGTRRAKDKAQELLNLLRRHVRSNC
ncbi:U-box domain-containing protein 4-like [Benincasa hispida]|uniref:U-box domain-containing protein 4-like n=1 Tax=Benincasa hispida TaxID=102211 RepID=UPI001902915D|nr:U-box domain-containing protein 4-like [Benincasa hispida]XP_038880841.1 U-box domain-containing protein 4-like [Benincasa hispida]XP_038880842.1 U-box domain-containing protein 4-like [Benincasa hispida]